MVHVPTTIDGAVSTPPSHESRQGRREETAPAVHVVAWVDAGPHRLGHAAYHGAVKNTRPNRPKPVPFIATGAIIGFIVFGLISVLRPNENTAYDITYDAGAALGMMSVLGLFVGGIVGAVVAALLTYRR